MTLESGYPRVLVVGVLVSVLLHVAGLTWWLQHTQAQLPMLGAPEVVVDLIAPVQPSTTPQPPVSQPEAAKPAVQQPTEQTRPEAAKADEMAVQHKPLSKKKAEKRTAEKTQQKQVLQATAPEAALAARVDAVSAAPITAARFDANYLSHPVSYPPLSRRLGEEGRVVLRVEVSAEGKPVQVVLKDSSGFERLDQAALDTVSRWQFSPAQQGGRAVASKVDVPILFKLKRH